MLDMYFQIHKTKYIVEERLKKLELANSKPVKDKEPEEEDE
jgi:hypothetical protein